MTFTETIYV